MSLLIPLSSLAIYKLSRKTSYPIFSLASCFTRITHKFTLLLTAKSSLDTIAPRSVTSSPIHLI